MNKLIREHRKTISISVGREGAITVKAPYKMKIEDISNFCKEKSSWIKRQQLKQEKIANFKIFFDFENFIYIFGEKLNPEQVNLSLSTKQIILQNKFEKIYMDFGYMLLEMAKQKAKELKLDLASVKLTKSNHFWGSLDRQKNMKLNYKLIILPKPLVEYVIIHELCHGIELNHSPKFWEVVKGYCPDYKNIKKQLELYSFLFDNEKG